MKKRWRYGIAWILIAVMLCSFPVYAAPINETADVATTPMTADFSLKLLKHIVGKQLVLTETEWFSANAVTDGQINGKDALEVLKISVGKAALAESQSRSSELLAVLDMPVIRSGYTGGASSATAVINSVSEARDVVFNWFDPYHDYRPTDQIEAYADEDFYQDHTLLLWMDTSMSTQALKTVSVHQRGEFLLMQVERGEQTETAAMRLILVAISKTEASQLRIQYRNLPVYPEGNVQYYNLCLRVSFDKPMEITTVTHQQELIQCLNNYFVNENSDNIHDLNQQILPGISHRFAEGFYDQYVTLVCRIPGPRLMLYYFLSEIGQDRLILDTYRLLPQSTNGQLGGIFLGDDLVFIDLPVSQVQAEEYSVIVNEPSRYIVS